MDPSEIFKNYAAGIQSIFVILGLLAGGIWTIWNFNLLHARKIAKSQLKELESKLKEWGEINASIEAWQIEGLKENEYIVAAKFIFTNTGNRYVELDLSTYPCSVAEVVFDTNNQPIFNKIYSSQAISISGSGPDGAPGMTVLTMIEPGGSTNYPAIFKVDSPGIYIVESKVGISEVEEERLKSEGIMPPTALRPTWSVKTFVVVK